MIRTQKSPVSMRGRRAAIVRFTSEENYHLAVEGFPTYLQAIFCILQ